MMRKILAAILFAIGVFCVVMSLFMWRAQAQELPPKVCLSGPLIEEIGRILMSRPYSESAGTIGKLQAEIQHQPQSPQVGPGPSLPPRPLPPEETKKDETPKPEPKP